MNKVIQINGSKVLTLVLSLLFIVLNSYAIYRRIYVFSLLPVVLLMGYLLIYQPRFVLLFIVLLTPLSVNLEDLSILGGIGVYLPTEPLLLSLMLLYFLKILTGFREDRKLIDHPLSVAIIISLLVIFFTAVASTMPVVSFKFLLARMWFVVVMYFLVNKFMREERFIRLFFLLYMLGLAAVIIYTVTRHSMYGFEEDPAHWVMSPFFKDHTSYGAILALLFPMVIFHFYRAKALSLQQLMFAILLAIFCVGLVLSYTRAAWMSLLGAMGVFVLIKLRIDFKLVVLTGILVTGLYFGFEDQIMHNLEKNRQDSSGDLKEHVQSMTNISTDASNLERLNRWNSAMRMFTDKPFFGYGPGTYMFTYATFQKSGDKTIISTNQGDGGNAHSEYLGPLSESGVLGAFSMLAVFVISLVTGIRLYYKLSHNTYLKGVVMCIVLGLVTYYLHGILNNYLDTDKASVPLWGMMSILVAIELYHLPGSTYLNRQQSRAVSSK